MDRMRRFYLQIPGSAPVYLLCLVFFLSANAVDGTETNTTKSFNLTINATYDLGDYYLNDSRAEAGIMHQEGHSALVGSPLDIPFVILLWVRMQRTS